MQLRTGTTRAHISHFPKIIFFIPIQNTIFRQITQPKFTGIFIGFQTVFFIPLKNSSIKPVFFQMHYLGKKLPSISDGFFFKVIPEGPVPQHLKHRMMVSIMSYFFQIVMFSGNPQTFLRIGHPFVFSVHISQYDIFKLIHSCIGKHQCRIVLDNHRSRRYNGMRFTFKKIEKFLSDFCRFHFYYIFCVYIF